MVARESKHQVWNASQDDSSLGVCQAEGGVVRRLQRANVNPSACSPGREMAVGLVKGQKTPLGKAVYGRKNARHDGPRGLPAQFGTHPEASGAGVRQGQDAQVFGGNTHGMCCGALVHGGK